MPHRCAECGTVFSDAGRLKDGCPVCGCAKFFFESGRVREKPQASTPAPAPAPLPEQKRQIPQKTPAPPVEIKKDDKQPADSLESIRILEPGRYDLNLSRLAESDDRVVKVGTEETYRLDLHSMIRKKKKK